MAVATVATMTYFALGLRWGRGGDMTPAIAFASLVATFLAALIGTLQPFDVNLHDFILLVVWGAELSTVLTVFFLLASCIVPGGEMMLFVAIEAVPGPLWVWLAQDEVPTEVTFYGGALVLVSIIGFAVTDMRAEHRMNPV
ncbi:MAG: hypothetical protein GDA49_07130 [Rhodospirillales bacterium]|nr:hypothetical protein [Rhodospirillales bacterium]